MTRAPTAIQADFGFTSTEHKAITLGATAYKITYLTSPVESALAVARALKIIQEHKYGDGARGSYREALIRYGFTDRSKTAPIDPALRSLYGELLKNESAVLAWWNDVPEANKDQWTSVRSIHRHWKESTEPNVNTAEDSDTTASRSRTNGNGRKKSSVKRPKGASMDEIDAIANATLHRPTHEQMEARMAESAEAEAFALATPRRLSAVLREAMALIDDPNQWPSSAKATRAQNKLRTALMTAIDILAADLSSQAKTDGKGDPVGRHCAIDTDIRI